MGTIYSFTNSIIKSCKVCLSFVVILLAFNINVFSQCSPCTTCNTPIGTGCTVSITANSNTNYNVTAATKICITGGTYTGNITMSGGAIVVGSGAAFNPGIFSIQSGLLEIQGGATSTMPSILANGNSAFFTINNCGSIHFTGSITNNGGRMIINNNGVFTSSSTILYNGSVLNSTICNSDTLTCTGLTLNGTTGIALTNIGYMLVAGAMVQNGPTSNINLCCGSLLAITGNWTANSSNTTTGIGCPAGNCGEMTVGGTSLCNGCNIKGCMDICDSSAMNKPCPRIDIPNGSHIDSSITYCHIPCATANPVVTINGGSICAGSCFNVSATVTNGTPPYTFNWSPNIGSGAGPFSVCPTVTTTYTVSITDGLGKVASDTATVIVNPLPLVTVGPSNPKVCNGLSITLTASGGVSYSWSPLTGLSNPNIANPVASPTITTTYTVTATDANGCSASAAITVLVGNPPIVTISASKSIGCDSNTIYIGYGPQSITLTANVTGQVSTYQWFLNGIAIIGDTTKSITISAGGLWNVIATDSMGCQSDTTNKGILINVIDVRCGHDLKKVLLCHAPDGNPGNAHSLCIAPTAVRAHLRLHPKDCIGPCHSSPRIAELSDEDTNERDLQLSIHPNPTTGVFNIILNRNISLNDIEVFDLVGKKIYLISRTSQNEKGEMQMQLDAPPGIYFVKVKDGERFYTAKLIIAAN